MSEFSDTDSYVLAPNPCWMISAMRGMGYSTQMALADIVDNSITAGARNIDIEFDRKRETAFVMVLDDGCGMSEEELHAAMRFGSRNPLEERPEGDLGRFGLGMKTASFSQCRSLTVASRKAGTGTVVRRWDLDFLERQENPQWTILTEPGPEAGRHVRLLDGRNSGTLVVWEKLDRIVTPDFTQQNLLDLVDAVRLHLGLVFQRFLTAGSDRKVTIRVNGTGVRPVDPFMEDNLSTRNTPQEPVGRCIVRGFVLPSEDLVPVSVSGPDARRDGRQGFYVYRADRLLAAGGWFGLAKEDPAFALVRIRIDIPPECDKEWKLDILKSKATPPAGLRERLGRLAERVCNRAAGRTRTSGERGDGNRDSEPEQELWIRERCPAGYRYRISRTHPAVSALLEHDRIGHEVEKLLTLVESTLPIAPDDASANDEAEGTGG